LLHSANGANCTKTGPGVTFCGKHDGFELHDLFEKLFISALKGEELSCCQRLLLRDFEEMGIAYDNYISRTHEIEQELNRYREQGNIEECALAPTVAIAHSATQRTARRQTGRRTARRQVLERAAKHRVHYPA
jgi:hypothetical protein